MGARGEDLRANGRRMVRQERQQSVRGGGGDDFEDAGVLKLFEGGDEVAVVMPPRLARRGKFVVIHPREVAEGAVPVRAMNFLFREINQAVEVPQIAFADRKSTRLNSSHLGIS